MKNIVTTIFMLVVCIAGTVIAAAVYFTVTFGVLGWLLGTGGTRVGEAVGAAAGALGFPVGAAIFGMLFWDRLVREDGSPDRVARGLALIIGLPLALIPLLSLGLPALEAAVRFKAPGFLALGGFLGLAGWVEERMRK